METQIEAKRTVGVPKAVSTASKEKDEVTAIANKWKKKRGSLIMALHDLQSRVGYVPRESAMKLGHEMGVPLARIYEVVTFYNYFKLEAPGKYVISVCTGHGVPHQGFGRTARRDGERTEDPGGAEHSGQGVSPAGRALPGLLRSGAPGFGQRQGVRQVEDH